MILFKSNYFYRYRNGRHQLSVEVDGSSKAPSKESLEIGFPVAFSKYMLRNARHESANEHVRRVYSYLTVIINYKISRSRGSARLIFPRPKTCFSFPRDPKIPKFTGYEVAPASDFLLYNLTRSRKYLICTHDTEPRSLVSRIISAGRRGAWRSVARGMDFHGVRLERVCASRTRVAVRSCVAPPRPITLSATRVTPRAQCRRSRSSERSFVRFVASAPRKVGTLALSPQTRSPYRSFHPPSRP